MGRWVADIARVALGRVLVRWKHLAKSWGAEGLWWAAQSTVYRQQGPGDTAGEAPCLSHLCSICGCQSGCHGGQGGLCGLAGQVVPAL